MKRRNAYTLIELLVAITIIGILLTIGAVSWSAFAARSRDDTRKTEIRRMKNILEQYYADQRTYPTFVNQSGGSRLIYSAQWQLTDSTGGCTNPSLTNRLASRYVGTFPSAPKVKNNLLSNNCKYIADNQDNDYLYLSAWTTDSATGPTATPKDYALMIKLENAPKSGSNDFIERANNPLDTNYTGPTFKNYSSSNFNPNPVSGDIFSEILSPNYMVVKGTAE